jgi:hypothetical protein
VLQGDISDLVAKVAAAKKEVQSLGDASGTAIVDADISPLEAKLVEARALLDAFTAKPVNVTIGANAGGALAGGAAGGGGGGGLAALLGASAGSGGGGGGGLGAVAGAAGGSAAAGGGTNLLTFLGWGGGIGGMAAFGSALSLAGFGMEHLMTTALGLGASLAGALAGGALLAAGALTTMAVGMGTDMAGMGQALGDIKNVVTAQNALSQAVAVYGAGSVQAVAAQNQLNYTLSSFSPLARAAVLQAANTAQGFHQMFNAMTGQAESTGANILNTLMLVAEKFLPTIGKYAAENMSIIQKALVPLETWIDGPGLAMFTQIEQKFQNELPTSMSALTNGVELVAKILDYVAMKGGGFMNWLNQALIKLNTGPSSVWEKWVNDLLGDFHMWWDLLKQIGITLYDVFANSKGLASGIVTDLTNMLKLLDKWLTSTSGKASVGNLFEVHLKEYEAILGVLPALLSSFGQLYLDIAPMLTQLVVWLADIVSWMIKIPGVGPILAWAAAILLLGSRMKALAILSFIASLPELGAAFVAFAGEEGIGAATVAVLGLNIASLTLYATLASLAVPLAAFLLLWSKMPKQAFGTPAKSPIPGVSAPSGSNPNSIGPMAQSSWNNISSAMKAFFTGAVANFFEDIGGWFHSLPGTLVGVWNTVVSALGNFFSTIAHWVESGPSQVHGAFNTALGAIGSFFSTIGGWFRGLPGDVAGAWKAVTGAIGAFFSTIGGWFRGLWGGVSGDASSLLGDVGKFFNSIGAFFTGLPGQIGGYLSTLLGDIGKGISGVGTAIWKAIQGLNPVSWLGSLFSGHAFGGSIPIGGWGIVGEQGPELAYAGAGGTVIYPGGHGGTSAASSVQIDNHPTVQIMGTSLSQPQLQAAVAGALAAQNADLEQRMKASMGW